MAIKNLRNYGKSPFAVAVIHGGPGAAGEMAPVARELAAARGVLEPLQTSGSIMGQVQELYDVLKMHGELPITLIGYSWGAWLSFIFATRYPWLVKKIILVGSGPFDEKYASTIMETRLSRFNKEERLQFYSLQESLTDPNVKDKNELLAQFGKLMSKADSFDPLKCINENEEIEIRQEIFQSVWKEASELRESGKLLELGKQIKCPVVAIHGDYDSHPYAGVEETLSKIIEDFRFVLLKNCGHTPWMERVARDRFYKILSQEMSVIA